MTILSDKQIRTHCTKPTFVLTHREQTFYTIMSAEVIDKFNQDQGISPEQELNDPKMSMYLIKRRELTEEESGAWKSMITPFTNGQVRKQRRDPTNAELRSWANARHSGFIPEQFVSDDLDKGVQIEEKIISYGLSSFGYDVRLADEFKIFTNINSTVVNPKNFDDKSFVDFKGDVCIIPPNSFVLARTLEAFNMPTDVTGIVYNKSTYARCGINCFTTVIEAGWKGVLVLEFANTTTLPAMLFANEGVAQIVFLKGNEVCEVSYADRNGKYQNQQGITLPKV